MQRALFCLFILTAPLLAQDQVEKIRTPDPQKMARSQPLPPAVEFTATLENDSARLNAVMAAHNYARHVAADPKNVTITPEFRSGGAVAIAFALAFGCFGAFGAGTTSGSP